VETPIRGRAERPYLDRVLNLLTGCGAAPVALYFSTRAWGGPRTKPPCPAATPAQERLDERGC
jgi:hypothetical protein